MDKIKAAFEKLNSRERVLIVLVALALQVVGAKAFIWEEYRMLGLLELELKDGAAQLQKKQELLNEAVAAHAKSSAADPDALAVYRENTGLSGLVREVTNLEKRSGSFQIMRLSNEKHERLPEFDKTVLTLEVEAPFQTIGGFLEQLEKSRLLTRVDGVEVFRIEKELRRCRARISLNSYTWRSQ